MATGDGFGPIRTLAADLRRQGPIVSARAAAVVRRSAHQVEAIAKQNAPVRTGNLRNSVSTTIRTGRTLMSAEVGPTANYGGYVEHGTSRIAPQPYLGPALDAVEPGFVAAMQQAGQIDL